MSAENIILTTTNNIEGRMIKSYLGIIKQSAAFSFDKALLNLQREALKVKGDAVVGLKIHREFGAAGTEVYGTVVKLD